MSDRSACQSRFIGRTLLAVSQPARGCFAGSSVCVVSLMAVQTEVASVAVVAGACPAAEYSTSLAVGFGSLWLRVTSLHEVEPGVVWSRLWSVRALAALQALSPSGRTRESR